MSRSDAGSGLCAIGRGLAFRPAAVALLLAFVILPPRPARAQADPEAAARTYAAALQAGDWAAASRLMHPDALRQLRELFEPLLSTAGGAEVRRQMFGVNSTAELASTPDTVLFARFLATMMAQKAGLAEALRTSRYDPLGHVPGGGDTVLVVSRLSMMIEGVQMTQFEVMPFLRQDGQWRALLKADFTNLAAAIQRMLGAQGS